MGACNCSPLDDSDDRPGIDYINSKLCVKNRDVPKPAISKANAKRKKLSGTSEGLPGALSKNGRRPFCFHVESGGKVFSSPAISHQRSLSAKHCSEEDQETSISTIRNNPRSILSFLANSNKSKQISPLSTSSPSVPDHMRLLVSPNLPRRFVCKQSLSSHLRWRNGLSQPIQTVIIEAETRRNSLEDTPRRPTTSRHLKSNGRAQGYNWSCDSEETERDSVDSFKRPIMGTQKTLSSFRSIPWME
ncbi:hypothetical protein AAMO2058_000754000 [Amorphochlora amoebiformis]